MAPNGQVLSEEEHSKAVAAFQKLGVCEQLAEAAASLGWKSPSSIQEQAVPLVLQGGQGRWGSRAAAGVAGRGAAVPTAGSLHRRAASAAGAAAAQGAGAVPRACMQCVTHCAPPACVQTRM